MNKVIILITFLIFSGTLLWAQTDTLHIATTAQCPMCKKTIEETLAFEKGVKSSMLDIETKVVTVLYRAKRTNPDNIRKAISKAGYDADDVKADERAYSRLPGCCKKPDDPEHEKHE